METIDRMLTEVEIGPARTFGGMTVYPLLGGKHEVEPCYRTLDRALRDDDFRIREIGEDGRVPELRIENRGKRPVLLLDGEELVGAKQNRVLNVTVLAPAGKTIVIPVSCVEAGRWAWSASRDFGVADHVMYSAGRMAKAEQVAFAAGAGRGFASDQGAIWSNIARKLSRLRAASPSSAMGDAFRQRSQSIEDYVLAFPSVERQTGGIFAIGGRLTGVEVFDHPATLRELLPKVVRSYALDAIELVESSTTTVRGTLGGAPGAHEVPSPDQAAGFLREIREAKTEVRPAVGLGRDVRLTGLRVVGGALVHEDRIVHLSAFRRDGNEAAGGDGIGGHQRARSARLHRAKGRRNGRSS